MNVLFLTSSTGGGHLKAAEAIKEYINLMDPHATTHIIDTLKCIHPLMDKLLVGSYLNTIKRAPTLYGKFYCLADHHDRVSNMSKTFSKLASLRLFRLIDHIKPSVIICTHSLPVQMLSHLKCMKLLNVPVIAVVTDYVHHRFWKLEKIDAFIVAHDQIKNNMVKLGLLENTLYSYGIPVSKSFYVRKNRKELLMELGLKDMPTALIMGGSLGFGEITKIFKALIHCERQIQIIALAGMNLKLKKRLESIACGVDKPIKILGYVNHVSDLMDVADFILTKPGGMTVSEALAKQIPLFVISPIPGQEESNARFLINHGAAIRILPEDNVEDVLYQILQSPMRLKQLKESSKSLAQPDACMQIAKLAYTLSTPSATPVTMEMVESIPRYAGT